MSCSAKCFLTETRLRACTHAHMPQFLCQLIHLILHLCTKSATSVRRKHAWMPVKHDHISRMRSPLAATAPLVQTVTRCSGIRGHISAAFHFPHYQCNSSVAASRPHTWVIPTNTIPFTVCAGRKESRGIFKWVLSAGPGQLKTSKHRKRRL